MSMRRPNKIWLMLSRNTGCVIDEILSVFPVCSLVFIGCTGAKFLNDRLKTPLYARLFGYFSFVDYCHRNAAESTHSFLYLYFPPVLS